MYGGFQTHVQQQLDEIRAAGGVPFEVVQEHVGRHVVAVPTVLRPAPLVGTVGAGEGDDAVVERVDGGAVAQVAGLTEHTLAAAVVTIAAIGIFVILQQELRPYHLVTNIWYVAVGWLISVSVLVPVMQGLRKAWAAFDSALPLAGKLAGYLYGICERHPILALVIVGVGTTAMKDPRRPERIVAGLARWCDREGVRRMDEIIGALEWPA